jgi:Trypsin
MHKNGIIYATVLCLSWFLSALPVASEPRLGTQRTPGFPITPVSPPGQEVKEVVFNDLPDLANPVSPQLINGVEVDRRYFPTVFRKTTGASCTAVLIGPATMLTAAHCIESKNVSFKLRGDRVRGRCDRAPGYSANIPSQDWALCLLEFPIEGVYYETVGKNIPRIGTEVTLTGYGCTSEGGVTDDNVLRVGTADLSAKPAQFPSEPSTIYTRTHRRSSGPVICEGDSGGPLFIIPTRSFRAARTLVGVNSRSATGIGLSLFAALGSRAGRKFLDKWAEKRQRQDICGIGKHSHHCR